MAGDTLDASCGCFDFGSSYTPLEPETEPDTNRALTARRGPELLTLAFSDISFTVTSIKPDGTGSSDLAALVSRAEAMSRPGRRKHATMVYHVIWAELSEDTLTVSFVEKKKKNARTVCIKARLQGSTVGEAAEWVEDLLNVAYKGAIPIPSLWDHR